MSRWIDGQTVTYCGVESRCRQGSPKAVRYEPRARSPGLNTEQTEAETDWQGSAVKSCCLVWERPLYGEESENPEVPTFELKPQKEASQADKEEGTYKSRQ